MWELWSTRECLCCQEIDQIVKKCQQTDNLVQCILKRDGFKEVCMNPEVLYTAYFCYKQQYPNVEDSDTTIDEKTHMWPIDNLLGGFGAG